MLAGEDVKLAKERRDNNEEILSKRRAPPCVKWNRQIDMINMITARSGCKTYQGLILEGHLRKCKCIISVDKVETEIV